MRAVALLLAALVCGCGAAAQGARDLAVQTDALWTANQAVRSIASGRATADGPLVLWVADERRVTRVRADGDSEEVWTPPVFQRILRLEALDLTGDGASEWVVTLDGSRVRSFVLGYVGGSWQELAPGEPGFLRPLVGPDGSPWLLAQSAGAERPFSGPVRRLQLVEKGLEEVERLTLPLDISLHDLVYVPTADGGHRLFTFEPNGQLGERDPRTPRALIWRADARTVSRPVSVERDYSNLLGEEHEDRLELPVPAQVVDLDGDGTRELLTVAGPTTPVAVLDNVRVLQGGDARVMVPAARGLEERVRSPLLGRAMVGVVRFRDAAGHPALAAAVWTRADTGFARPETRVLLLDPTTGDVLPGPGAALRPATP